MYHIYTYAHNYQGDIIAILDSTGAIVVEYYYDAWGRQYSVTGSMKDTLGKLNPFRYRGYVYDEETSLYYLRSRYYNPLWGRFINADTVLGKVGALGSHNLFAYCGNNPSNYEDPDGNYAMALALIGGSLLSGLFGASCSYLVKKRLPRITLPKISITGTAAAIAASSASLSATTASEVYTAISGVNPVRADQFENHYSYNYYIAFCKKPDDNSYLYIIPIALKMEQAVTMVKAENLMNRLMQACGSTGAYGIYTPFYEGAMALESLVGGFEHGQKSNHGNSDDAKPGQYFNHFHDAGHNYHIWYGAPMNVGIG